MAYIVYGNENPIGVNVSSLADPRQYLLGAADVDDAGRFVSGAGDVNGDWSADLPSPPAVRDQ